MFRFASPLLQPSRTTLLIANLHSKDVDTGYTLRECPTGYIMRTAPWVYDLAARLRFTEAMGPLEFSQMPRFFQQMVRVQGQLLAWVGREHQLQRDIKRQQRHMERDLNG